MGQEFRKPDFSRKILELRFENDVVCIYGTAEGLKQLADLCLELIKNPNEGHMHLEDYDILTKLAS
jgi:hypothetical protein